MNQTQKQEIDPTDVRCPRCDKLLMKGKPKGNFEMKCPRCRRKINFVDGEKN